MMQSGYTVKRYSELPKTIILTRRSHFSIEVLPIAQIMISMGAFRFQLSLPIIDEGPQCFLVVFAIWDGFWSSLCDLFICVFTTLRRH